MPDNLIEEEIEQTIEEQYGRDRSVFIKTLEALGLNLETYKERIREKIIVRYMQQSEVSNEIIISPYKIEKYYADHPDEFHEGEKVKVRMIYIKKGDTPEEAAGAKSLIQEILLKLTTGLEESRDLIERLLISEERSRLQKRWLASLRQKAYIRMY